MRDGAQKALCLAKKIRLLPAGLTGGLGITLGEARSYIVDMRPT